MGFFPDRLHSRMVLLICTTLLVSGGLAGWISASQQSRMLVAMRQESASVLTKNLSESCAYYLVLSDYAGLETLLLKTAKLPGVVRLLVNEPGGRIVSHVERRPGAEPVAIYEIRSMSPQEDHIRIESERMTIREPIAAGRTIGNLSAVFSMSDIRKTQQETLRNSLLLALAFSAGSSIVLLLVMRPAVRSFRTLIQFSKSLDEHKGANIASTSGIREIADLAASLNSASEKISTSEQLLRYDRDRLRESEERYRQLLETVQEGIWVIDRNSVTTFVNPRMAELLGYAPEEMLGNDLFAFMDDEGREIAARNVERRKRGIKEQHDFEFIKKDGTRIFTRLEMGPLLDKEGQYDGAIASVADITETRRLERQRQAHLRFLESMNKIDRVIQGANDPDVMMREVLDTVLSIFDCDRSFLCYPCDPCAASWRVPIERTKPEYPGILEPKLDMLMDEAVAATFRLLLKSDGPVKFGPGTPNPLPGQISERFDIKCFMSMALYPKMGKPWQFGIHQCSFARVWTSEEERLFQEIGRRLSDALTSLLAHRDLRESEERYRMVFENSPISIWEEDFSRVKERMIELRREGVEDIRSHLHRYPECVRELAALTRIIDVNKAALVLHGAATKQELLGDLAATFTTGSYHAFIEELSCIWAGRTEMIHDSSVKTFGGETRHVTVYFSVCPGYEKTLARVLVSLVDITERKQAEDSLRKLTDELEQRVRERTEQVSAKNEELERINRLFVGRELRMLELKRRIAALGGAEE